MKLLFAIKRLASAAGGAERVLCTVCSELAARGHDVAIVTFEQAGEQSFYSLDERVRRIDLGVGDSARPARMVETLRRIWALRRVTLAERPDVAVGFMHSMFVPLAFALAGTSIPVLASEHIVPEHYRTRPLQYFSLIAASALISRMTVLSDSIRERYPYPLRKRMVVMPNPVVPADVLADVGGMEGRLTLLSVGRLDEQKDHATLLRAFAAIASDYPEWDLRIIGEGPLRHNLEQLTDLLGLIARVTMPGVTSEITREYQSAEVLVISSRYESFGLATAEAMSHGLPVVGFADCPGTNELIQDNETGLLVAPGEDRVTALAEALIKLMANPALRRQLGKSAKVAIDNRFSDQHVCDLWEDLLMVVAGNSTSPRIDVTHEGRQ